MAYLSRAANMILLTPFDERASDLENICSHLTIDEFFSHCYCYPIFERDEGKLFEKQEYQEVDNYDTTEEDAKLLYREYLEKIDSLKKRNEHFETWMNTDVVTTVYTISGNAGVGKTTLVNYLKYIDRIKGNNRRWTILDISNAGGSIDWIGDYQTKINFFNKPNNKVYEIILEEIFNLTFNELDETTRGPSFEKIYSNFTTIVTQYQNNYKKGMPAGSSLFQRISDLFGSDKLQTVMALGDLFSKYFSDSNRSIEDALNILLLLLRCRNDNENQDDRYIIVIDNFEKFIKEDEIYNKDVDKIRERLSLFTRRINREVSIHKNRFKFIMSIRTSTIRRSGIQLQYVDVLPNDLDIGEWFSSDKIVNDKRDWYKKNEKDIPNAELLFGIVGDRRKCRDGTITGLQLQLDPLFNYNKRLLIDFIGSILESPKYKPMILKYDTLWREDNQESRFAARSIIRGLILDSLKEQDNLFMHLKTYSIEVVRKQNTGRATSSNRAYVKPQNGIGDARKILTIIYNIQNQYEDKVVPIADVLKVYYNSEDVIEKWNSSDNNLFKKRKVLSEILFFMNSYNRRVNDWIQFLDLQIKECHSDISIRSPGELESLIQKKMEDITVHLMPAGMVYLHYIVPSFEFFSVRYFKYYEPLFATIPTPDEIQNVKDVNKLKCFKIINITTQYTHKCLSILQHEDTIALQFGDGKNAYYHADRIRNQHVGYLQKFVSLIKTKYMQDDSSTSYSKYKVLVEKIEAIMNERY